MRPESELYLSKAHDLLRESEAASHAGAQNAQGRAAYLAAFHAAQAIIFELSGKAAKTHRGVHSEFQRLTRNEPRLEPGLRSFLSRAYELKSIADYEIGPEATVAPDKAAEALEMARRFVAHIEALLA